MLVVIGIVIAITSVALLLRIEDQERKSWSTRNAEDIERSDAEYASSKRREEERHEASWSPEFRESLQRIEKNSTKIWDQIQTKKAAASEKAE
jgi:hypothetical protein